MWTYATLFNFTVGFGLIAIQEERITILVGTLFLIGAIVTLFLSIHKGELDEKQ